MYWIGVDHHKHNSYVTSLNADGTVYCRHNLSANAAVLRAFFASHPRPFTVGIEATYAWEYVADIVEALGASIQVAHPLLLKGFARRHKKNDKIDSMLIAWLLYLGHLPVIAHPPQEARQQRDLYRQRMEMVSRRTGAACRAKAWADRLGFQTCMNLSTQNGMAAFASLPVGPKHLAVRQSHVSALMFHYDEIGRLQRTIDQVAAGTPETRWLMTIPGIGAYLALLIASEVFDITRFPNARHLASYAGVTPGVACSGGKNFGGHRHPAANKYLRWAFTETVRHYVRANPWARRSTRVCGWPRGGRRREWRSRVTWRARCMRCCAKAERTTGPGAARTRRAAGKAYRGENRRVGCAGGTTGVVGLSWGLRGCVASPAEI